MNLITSMKDTWALSWAFLTMRGDTCLIGNGVGDFIPIPVEEFVKSMKLVSYDKGVIVSHLPADYQLPVVSYIVTMPDYSTYSQHDIIKLELFMVETMDDAAFGIWKVKLGFSSLSHRWVVCDASLPPKLKEGE